jgi:hypothetical protein
MDLEVFLDVDDLGQVSKLKRSLKQTATNGFDLN